MVFDNVKTVEIENIVKYQFFAVINNIKVYLGNIDVWKEHTEITIVKYVKISSKDFLDKIQKYYDTVYVEGYGLSTHLKDGVFLPAHYEDENLYFDLDNVDYINLVVGVEKKEICVLAECISDGLASIKTNGKVRVKSTSTVKTYLMKDGNGFYKIGKSKNPIARESTLQSENPTITLIAVCSEDIEKHLHEQYSEKRKRGEWFNLTEEDISLLIEQYGFADCSVIE